MEDGTVIWWSLSQQLKTSPRSAVALAAIAPQPALPGGEVSGTGLEAAARKAGDPAPKAGASLALVAAAASTPRWPFLSCAMGMAGGRRHCLPGALVGFHGEAEGTPLV